MQYVEETITYSTWTEVNRPLKIISIIYTEWRIFISQLCLTHGGEETTICTYVILK